MLKFRNLYFFSVPVCIMTDKGNKLKDSFRMFAHILKANIKRAGTYSEFACNKGSLTLAMGKCLWFSVKIKVCQSSLSSP